MTVKQFIYLAVGIIISWFIFVSKLFFLIKYPLILLFAGGGVALAFVPIGGRPLDTMLINFIKAFFAETTYVYKKNSESFLTTPQVTTHASPVAHPSPTPVPTPAPAVPKETHPAPPPPPAVVHEVQNKPQEIHEENNVSHSVPQDFEVKAAPLYETPPQKPASESSSHIMLQHTAPQAQAVPLPQPSAPPQQPEKQSPEPSLPQAPVQSTAQPQAPTHSQNVRQVPVSLSKSAGIPVAPEAPNLITGIVKDPRGNPLGNILVEVKDQEGNPVRAFKTNGLGRFASATPLSDGNYTIEFEDLKGENKFQKVAFSAKGEVIMPFEIISTDKREELRRELFN